MGIIDLLYPKKCLECKSPGKYLCRSCVEMVPKPKPDCPTCKKPSIDGVTHIKCLTPHGLDGLFSLFGYKGVIRKAITRLKYNHAVDVGIELATYSAEILEKNSFLFNKNQTLAPVPLYWYKENVRGFNQSSELGRSFAQKFGWSFVPDFLVKKSSTTPQAELNRSERKKNVKRVFAFNPKHLSLVTSNLSVILFDDVYTTGFTLTEACKALKRNGVQKVWGLTISR